MVYSLLEDTELNFNMTTHHSINALSPLDGRYFSQTNVLANFFSESALLKYRLKIEIEYLINFLPLSGQKKDVLTEQEKKEIRNIYLAFSDADAAQIKDIEKKTNHDVKAVEYFLREKVAVICPDLNLEMIHFGLTSQDINNTAFPLMIKDAMEAILLPAIDHINQQLLERAKEWKGLALLAHTHGQPATPTNLGKEFMVFCERLSKQIEQIKNTGYEGKFGGASGNFNAHKIAYPKHNWVEFGNTFLKNLGLNRQQFTTQIEHYDNLAQLLDGLKRISTILMDLCRDCWMYISMNYFIQKTKEGEVGSSAMPHKVNPIDFENAEGNLGICIALLEHLSAKLPISRLQRDLTDSTVLRNIGVPLGHLLIALKSVEKGLGKLVPNEDRIRLDLENNWAIVAEAIQTILRRENFEHPYEALRKFSRGNRMLNRESMNEFIEQLSVAENVKSELRNISPFNYSGEYPDFK